MSYWTFCMFFKVWLLHNGYGSRWIDGISGIDMVIHPMGIPWLDDQPTNPPRQVLKPTLDHSPKNPNIDYIPTSGVTKKHNHNHPLYKKSQALISYYIISYPSRSPHMFHD
jgi:hypothetical protein